MAYNFETSNASGAADTASLVDALRARTQQLHRTAERSGIVRQILQGEIGRDAYALFLRNLLPAYEALERGLERHAHTPAMRSLVRPCLYRASSLRVDLDALCGNRWESALPVLPAARRYAERVASVAEGDGAGLIAHVYVRYLGDLNGGRIVGRIVQDALRLEHSALTFYRFADIHDIESFKTAYRGEINRALSEIASVETVADEAVIAFRLSIDVSEEVQAHGLPA